MRTDPIYYIAPSAISIIPNANGTPNDLAVSVAKGTKIKVYYPPIFALGFVDGSFQEWTLAGRNRSLVNTTAPHTIYARLRKVTNLADPADVATAHADAYLVFAPQTQDEDTGKWKDPYILTPITSRYGGKSSTGADGRTYTWGPISARQAADGRSDYWWVKLGTVSAPVEGQRTVNLDTGILGTDQYNQDWYLDPDNLPLRIDISCKIGDNEAGSTPFVRWDETLQVAARLVEGWGSDASSSVKRWTITRNTGDTEADAAWNYPDSDTDDDAGDDEKEVEASEAREMTGGRTALSHSIGADDLAGAMATVFTIRAWGAMADDSEATTGEEAESDAEAEPEAETTTHLAVLATATITVLAETIEDRDTPINAYRWYKEGLTPSKPTDTTSEEPAAADEVDTRKAFPEKVWRKTAPDRPANGEWALWMCISTKHSNGSIDEWAGPIRISGIKGDAGEDGSDREYIYKRLTTDTFQGKKPSEITEGEVSPEGIAVADDDDSTQDDWVPYGWSDTALPATADEKFVYISIREKPAGTDQQWGPFSDPILWSNWGVQGMDGDGVQYVYRLFDHELEVDERETNIPVKPASQNANGEWIPDGWNDNPLAPYASMPYCYCSVIQKINGTWGDFGPLGLWSKWSADGQDVITLDLDNEMDAVPCDSNGVVMARTVVITNARIYKGPQQITTGIVNDDLPDVFLTGANNAETRKKATRTLSRQGVITYAWTFEVGEVMQDDRYTATIVVPYNNRIYSAAFTLNVVKSGEPGVSPTIYQLLPSQDKISFALDQATNTLTPASQSVYCGYKRIDGDGEANFPGNVMENLATSGSNGNPEGAVYTAPYNIFYRYHNADGTTSNWNWARGLANGTLSIPNNTAYAAVEFALSSATGYTSVSDVNIVDRERIPILKDGKNGADGQNAVRLDLTNEMDSVQTDSTGKVMAARSVTTVVRLYDGGSPVAIANPTVTAVNVGTGTPLTPTITPSTSNSTEKTLTWNFTTAMTLPVSTDIQVSYTYNDVTYYGVLSLKATMGQPVYQLLPAVATLTFRRQADNTLLEPAALQMSVLKIDGASTTSLTPSNGTANGNIVRYSKTAMPTTSTSGTAWPNAGVSVSTTEATRASNPVTNVYVALFNSAGTLLDRETVPVVMDGANGVDLGENIINNSESAQTFRVTDAPSNDTGQRFFSCNKTYEPAKVPADGTLMSGQARITVNGCTFTAGTTPHVVIYTSSAVDGVSKSWPYIAEADITANGTFDIKKEAVRLNSDGSNNNTGVYTGRLSFRIDNFESGTVTIERVKWERGEQCSAWSLSEADKRGGNTATIMLYKRSATDVTTVGISATLYYKFATRKLYADAACTTEATSSQLNGWSLTIPTDSTDPIFVTAAIAFSTTETDDIGSNEWVAPAPFTENGEDGAPGVNTATVFIYKRSESAPGDSDKPKGALTYTFATGEATIETGKSMNGWHLLIPETNGYPCYVRQAVALGAGATDTIETTDWSAAVKMVEDGADGAPGAAGDTPLTAYRWYKEGETVSAPTDLQNDAPVESTTNSNAYPTDRWSKTAPNRPADGWHLYQTNSVRHGTGVRDAWSTPVRISGATGSAGEDAKEREWVYKRAVANPGTPASSGTGKVGYTSKAYDDQLDDWVPNGWTDNPTGINVANPTEWASWRDYDKANSRWGSFHAPIIWSHYGERGTDGDGTEMVFIRTKGNEKPKIFCSEDAADEDVPYNNAMYMDSGGTLYSEDEFLPVAYVTNGTVEKNAADSGNMGNGISGETEGRYGECTDDPKGVSETWPFEWVAIRSKADADGNGRRPWNPYSGEMALWAKWAADGTSPWIADLDNEMDSVACNLSGKPTSAQTVSTNIDMYYGSQKKDFRITAIQRNGAASGTFGTGVTVKVGSASVNASSFFPTTAAPDMTVSVSYATTATISGKDEFTITMQAADDATVTRTLTFTVNGVRPGKDGENAKLYRIAPSAKSVVRRSSGSFLPAQVDVSFQKIDGEDVSNYAGTAYIYVDDEQQPQVRGQVSSVTLQPAESADAANLKFTKSVRVELFDPAGNVADVETIHVVRDGLSQSYYIETQEAWSSEATSASATDMPSDCSESDWKSSTPANPSGKEYLWRRSRTMTLNATGTAYNPGSWTYVRLSGTNGTSIDVKDSVATVADLQNISNPQDGDAYVCSADGHLYMWSSEASDWVDIGQFKGDNGVTYYVHIAWATSVQNIVAPYVSSRAGQKTKPNVRNTSDVTGFSTGVATGDGFAWQGIMVDTDTDDSTTPTDYTWNKVEGKQGRGYQGSAEYYAVGSSNSTAPDGKPSATTYASMQLFNAALNHKGGISSGAAISPAVWTPARPVYTAENAFLWNFEIAVLTDGTVEVSPALCIGNMAKGITEVLEFYALSASGEQSALNSIVNPAAIAITTDAITSDRQKSWLQPTWWFGPSLEATSDARQAGSADATPEDYRAGANINRAPTAELPYQWNWTRTVYNDGTYDDIYHVSAGRGADGLNASSIGLDLDNEHEDFLCDEDGNVLSAAVTSQATLYDGGSPIAAGDVSWAIDTDSLKTYGVNTSNSSDKAYASISTAGLLTVRGINAAKAKVTVVATYPKTGGTEYRAAFTANRRTDDKYDLVVTPNALKYNETTQTPATSTITVTVKRTTIAGGVPETHTPPTGYSLIFCDENGIPLEDNAGRGGNRGGNVSDATFTTNNAAMSSVRVAIAKLAQNGKVDEDSVLDSETVPIYKVENGPAGKDAVIYMLQVDKTTIKFSSDGAGGYTPASVDVHVGYSKTVGDTTDLYDFPSGTNGIVDGKYLICWRAIDASGNPIPTFGNEQPDGWDRTYANSGEVGSSAAGGAKRLDGGVTILKSTSLSAIEFCLSKTTSASARDVTDASIVYRVEVPILFDGAKGEQGADAWTLTASPSAVILNQSTSDENDFGLPLYIDFTAKCGDNTATVGAVTASGYSDMGLTVEQVNSGSHRLRITGYGKKNNTYVTYGRITCSVQLSYGTRSTTVTVQIEVSVNLLGTWAMTVRQDAIIEAGNRIATELGPNGLITSAYTGAIERSATGLRSEFKEEIGSSGAGSRNLFGFCKGCDFNRGWSGVPFIQGYGFVVNKNYALSGISRRRGLVMNLGFNGVGGHFVLSCQVSVSTGDNLRVEMNLCDVKCNANEGTVEENRYITCSAGAWTSCEMHFDIPSGNINISPTEGNQRNGHLYVGDYDGTVTTAGANIYVRHLKIERSDTATAFCEADEDIAAIGQGQMITQLTKSDEVEYPVVYGDRTNVYKVYVNTGTFTTDYVDYLYQNNALQLEKGKVYTLSFWACCSTSGMVISSFFYNNDVNPVITDNVGIALYNAGPGMAMESLHGNGGSRVRLSSSWTQYFLRFYVTKSSNSPSSLIAMKVEKAPNAYVSNDTTYYSSGTIYISDVTLQEGYVMDEANFSSLISQNSRRISLVQQSGMKRTGIDIYNGVIRAQADNFLIVNSNGQQTFSIDANGNLVSAGNAAFNGTVKANLFYSPATFLNGADKRTYTVNPAVDSSFLYRFAEGCATNLILPDASSYEGLEISYMIIYKRDLNVPAAWDYRHIVTTSNSQYLYYYANIANIKDTSGNTQSVIIAPSEYLKTANTSVRVLENNLYRIRAIRGAWYFVAGFLTGE